MWLFISIGLFYNLQKLMIYLDAHGTLSGTLQDKVWETAVQDKAVMLVPQNKNSDSEEHENVHMLTGLWHHLPEYPQVPCCPWWFHLSDHSEKDRETMRTEQEFWGLSDATEPMFHYCVNSINFQFFYCYATTGAAQKRRVYQTAAHADISFRKVSNSKPYNDFWQKYPA